MLDWPARGVHNKWQGGKVGELLAGGSSFGLGGMTELLQRTEARLVILAAAVAALVAVGIYVVAKVRRSFTESGPSPYDLVTNFRELHSQGELSDEEYRTIKAMLAARLQQQLKGRSEEG